MAGHVETDVAGQFEPLGVGACRADFDCLLHGFTQAEFDAFKLELAGFDLREIEDVVDDLQQRAGGVRDGLRQVPLPRSQFGCLQQFRHAHDAVHRRADFVAHAREKFALGAAGAFRRLFGAGGLVDDELQLAIGIAQIFRAIGDLLFEELAIFFQARVAMPDLPEHLIEAVDQRTDFVLGVALDAQAVILLGGNALHGMRQIDDGTGDVLLQPRREPVGDEYCRTDGREADQSIVAPVRVQRCDRHENMHIAEHRAFVRDRRRDLKLISTRAGRRAARIEEHAVCGAIVGRNFPPVG